MADSALSASKTNSKPTALVVGAAGFLGSHLCEILVSQNFNTIGVDNLRSGSRENLKNLLSEHNFHFFDTDINQHLPPLSEGEINYIFHLAGVEEYLNDQDLNLETLIVNSLGTKNLLDLGRERKSVLVMVSSADLYFGAISSTSLKYYFGKRAKVESLLTNHEAKRYAEALAYEYFKKYALDVRIARILDVYGPRMSLETGSQIGSLINNAFKQEKLLVEGDGLKTVHPTFVSDVVFGLFKLALSDLKGQILHLVSSEKTTVLSFAQELQKASGKNLEIVYQKQEETVEFPYHTIEFDQTRQKLNWQPKIGLAQGLKSTLSYFNNPQESKRELEVEKTSPPKLKFNWPFSKILKSPPSPPSLKKSHLRRTILLSTLSLILVALIYPIVSLFSNALIGDVQVKLALSKIGQGQPTEAKKEASRAVASFSRADSSLLNLDWLTNPLNLEEPAENFTILLRSAARLSNAIKELTESLEGLDGIVKGALMEDLTSSDGLETRIKKSRLSLKAAVDDLSLVQTSLATVDRNQLPKFIAARIERFAQEIADKGIFIKSLNDILEILPSLIGAKSEKSYLLLMQNNTELRPTGGFIGSYGLMTFKEGFLKELLVDDVYNPDGQLKEEITPPDPIRENLGELRWWLRDSNWNPSFPEAAKQAEWFFEKETGKKVDGVLALNLGMIQKLLKVTGKIKVPDFDEEIDETNLVSRSLYHSEINFFAGSTQKRDFLGSVSRVLLDKLVGEKKISWQLVQALRDSFKEKDLLVYLNDQAAFRVIDSQNWSGRVRGVEEAGINLKLTPEGVVNDYLYVIDANLGVNKADIYIKPKIDYLVKVDKKGERTASLTLNYTHTGESDTWPGGKYKDYVRVYVPEDSELLKSELSDLRDKFKVTQSADLGKKIFEFLIEVSPRSSKKVTLEYKLPGRIDLGDPQTYALLVQKQPGRGEVSFNFTMEVPEFFGLSRGGEKDAKNIFELEEKLTTDKIFAVAVSKLE